MHKIKRSATAATFCREGSMSRTHLWAASILVSSTIRAQGIPQARPDEVGLSNAALEAIAPLLKSWVDSGKFAGITAVIARHGKLAFVTSAGSLDSARARPIAVDDVFRLYSMTKPIASVAVMQLVERGKLRVEDPVSRFIPSFANVKVYAGGGAANPILRKPARPVTIADLLTHTAGLTYGQFGDTPVDSIYRRTNMMNPAWTLKDMADSITKLPLMFDPGSAFNYSLSVDVLGRIVEVVTGTTFDRYLDAEIFQPLGMVSTSFHATPDMARRATAVFLRGPDGKLHAATPLLASQYTEKGRYFSGGAGLLSTIPDYLRFTQMLLNGGELDGHRLLKPATVDLMMQNHIPASAIPIFPGSPEPPGKNGFGYGGGVRVDSDPAMPGSAGTFRWSGYATTFFWIDRKADLVAMLWTQYVPEPEVWAVDGEFQRLVYAAVK
jgi:CubicO group peptidase (beta-lactamase class C family)